MLDIRVGHADTFADAHRCGYPHYPTYVGYSAIYAAHISDRHDIRTRIRMAITFHALRTLKQCDPNRWPVTIQNTYPLDTKYTPTKNQIHTPKYEVHFSNTLTHQTTALAPPRKNWQHAGGSRAKLIEMLDVYSSTKWSGGCQDQFPLADHPF